MPSFSESSKKQLFTCDERIQEILNEVIKYVDFKVLEGHRTEELQNLYYEQGKSKLKFPQSKHNEYPSKAVDVAPWPIDWKDRERFAFLAGVVKGTARSMGYNIRWGGDWDSDNDFKDQTFFDLPHFEIID